MKPSAWAGIFVGASVFCATVFIHEEVGRIVEALDKLTVHYSSHNQITNYGPMSINGGEWDTTGGTPAFVLGGVPE